MRRRKKLPIEPKTVLIVFTLFCFALIIVSFRYQEKLSPIKGVAGDVVAPMQKGINSVGTWFSDKAKMVTTIKELLEENEQLKEELANISYENKILQQERYELADLRNLYKLDEKYASYPKVAARVISRDSNNWYNQFCIDKGSEDGLSVNMNVIAGDGLVGIITEVGTNWSKVRTIIDDQSNVSGMTLKASDTCNVKGNLELIDQGLIEIELADKDADIKEGDEIVTSHISDRYLEGILIGYVNSISVDSTNMTQSGYLTPAVSFDSLDTVLVITELKKELPKEAITY
jgi:rod shape-determining protein MreC